MCWLMGVRLTVDEVLLAVLLFRVIFAPWPPEEMEPFEKIEVTLARASSSSSSISSSS